MLGRAGPRSCKLSTKRCCLGEEGDVEVAEVEDQAVVQVVLVTVVIVGVAIVFWERRLIQREMLDECPPSPG